MNVNKYLYNVIKYFEYSITKNTDYQPNGVNVNLIESHSLKQLGVFIVRTE